MDLGREIVFLPGTRVWLNDVEITSFIRTGDQPVTVKDGQVVFANTGRPWTPRANRSEDAGR